MYIAPSTNIKLLKGVPLDNNYDDTIQFASVSDQTSYFSNLAKVTLTNNTYQRVNKGTMRVGVCADNIYDCNYMMFQNTNYGQKWFYAFINSIEYVNNDVSEITYEIDDIQTWYFDYDIEECFVEREHSATDELFEHIEPETLDVGEYMYLRRNEIDESEMCVYVMVNKVTFDYNGDGNSLRFIDDDSTRLTQGYFIDDTFCGSKIFAFRNQGNGLLSLQTLIDCLMNSKYGLAPERYVCAYMGLVSNDLNFNENNFCAVTTGSRGQHHVVTGNWDTNSLAFPSTLPSIGKPNAEGYGGYIAKNKKLYTYPYFFPMVYNGAGQSMELRYELGRGSDMHYNGGTIDILILSNILPPVQSIAMPTNYKCVSQWHDGEPNIYPSGVMTESISITNYPVCSFAYDAFKDFCNKNTIPAIINAGTNAFSILNGVRTTELQDSRALASATSSLVSNAGSFLSNCYKASFIGSIAKGNANCASPLAPNKMLKYYSCVCSITVQYAKRIDDYFTKYGYACGQVKKPNYRTPTARPVWNFIKTQGCHINGVTGLPSDSAKHICQIHDKGITFWKNASAIGKYHDANYNNSPIQGE